MTKCKQVPTTDITSQEGIGLSKVLPQKKYKVYGIIGRIPTFDTDRTHYLYNNLHNNVWLFAPYGNLTDGTMMQFILEQVQPQKVYNLGQADLDVNFDSFDCIANRVGTGIWFMQ